MADRKNLSIYIHIPFCVRKCLYCDFLSFPLGDENYVNQEIADYVNLLCREIVCRAQDYQKYQVISVFFGGGTPSLLAAEDLDRIMDAVRASFVVAAGAEITVECNPGTVTAEKLAHYITCGINRLSIGLQSAEDAELARIGRIHDCETFLRTYRLAKAAGFCNINVDLMTALPGQTAASYRRTLDLVCDLSPEHISAYSLILEEGTPLYENQTKYTFPDEEEERELYYMTERVLSKAGYHRYEISNYAREGRECRHNKVYWQRGNYLGFGLGAASLIENVRWKNPEELTAYRVCVEAADGERKTGTETGRGCGPDAGSGDFAEYLRRSGFCEVQSLNRQEQMEEFMFLGLRLMEGVKEEAFLKTFGLSVDAVYKETVAKLMREGLLTRGEGRLFLTPRGIDVSNRVFASFLF